MSSFADLQHNLKPDPAICPLCGRQNHCAVAADPDAKECWCESVEFPEELLAQIPDDAVRKRCVCQECLNQFNKTIRND